jgi:hypothetical protein
LGASLTGRTSACLALTHIKFDVGPGDFYPFLVKDLLDSSPQFAHDIPVLAGLGLTDYFNGNPRVPKLIYAEKPGCFLD